MPFNFRDYEQQCSRMSKRDLQREIAQHGETIAAAGAGTGFALLAVPLTMGISAVAIGGTAPAIINARKKRTIARKYLPNAPDVGPVTTTMQPGVSRTMRQRPAVNRAQENDDELPAYCEEGEAIDATEKQLYQTKAEPVPDADADGDMPPPTYDEATLRRMTMMGINPQQFHFPGRQRPDGLTSPSAPIVEENTDSNGVGSSRSNSEANSRVPSYQEPPDLLTSRPSSSLHSHDSPVYPRTPSPDHALDGHLDLANIEEESEQTKSKGKGRSLQAIFSRHGDKHKSG